MPGRFFKQIDATVPRGLAVHVVRDNLSAHKAPEITKWLAHKDHVVQREFPDGRDRRYVADRADELTHLGPRAAPPALAA